ncbi:MAG: DUF342 domain-containing protein [Deltaproteobacteria bacterium]|nr:DUF342 domain-containing protein [Deltaproteobacteria bacterium]
MIKIEINATKTEARLTILPDQEEESGISIGQLAVALKTNNIVSGISKKNLQDVMERFNQNPEQPASTIIAMEIPAKETIQHQYQFYFSSGKNIGQLRGNDKIDYKQKGTIRYFNTGDPLLIVTLGREGSPGRLVDGTIVACAALEPLTKYSAGSGVVLEEEENRLLFKAEACGRPLLNNKILSIENSLAVDGDVDLETGHIEFAGPIRIGGNLLAGFHVISNSDVTIGSTLSGSVRTRGNLLTRGGIIGADHQKIAVAGDLVCDFISGVNHLQTGGNLNVNKHIINSRIIVGKNLTCGEMITGDCWIQAFNGVSCTELGSDQGSDVRIEVGGNKELKGRIKKIEEFMEPLTGQSIAIVDQMGLQALMKKDISLVPEAYRAQAEKIFQQYATLESDISRLKNKKNELEKMIELGLQSRVTVRKRVYPGTIIKIGQELYEVKRENNGPLEFFFDNREKVITFEYIR